MYHPRTVAVLWRFAAPHVLLKKHQQSSIRHLSKYRRSVPPLFERAGKDPPVSALKLSSDNKRRQWKKWVWIGLAALAALQLYFVQEMLAALFLFTVLFIAVAAVVLILWLLDRASQQTVAWAEPQTRQLARFARHGVALVAHWR